MGPEGEKILELSHKLYNEENEKITFDEYVELCMTEPEFDRIHDIYWSRALKQYSSNGKKNN